MQLIKISVAYCLLKFLASGQSLLNSTNSNDSFQLPEVCNCSNNYENGQLGPNIKLFDTSPPTNNASSQSRTLQECGRLFTNDSALYDFSYGEARIHWPWSAFIGREGLSMGKYVQYKRGYSGSIIGKKWILSSTFSPLHDPTKELEKYYVITGARDLYRLQTAGPMVSMYTVKNITVHPKYLIDKDAEFSVNLIELEHEISFNQYVQPICLSASSKLKNLFPEKKKQKTEKTENATFEQDSTLVTGYIVNLNYSNENDQYGFYNYSNKLWQWSMKLVDFHRNYLMPSTVRIDETERKFQLIDKDLWDTACSVIEEHIELVFDDSPHKDTLFDLLTYFSFWEAHNWLNKTLLPVFGINMD